LANKFIDHARALRFANIRSSGGVVIKDPSLPFCFFNLKAREL
jgi:hypothetical protein